MYSYKFEEADRPDVAGDSERFEADRPIREPPGVAPIVRPRRSQSVTPLLLTIGGVTRYKYSKLIG